MTLAILVPLHGVQEIRVVRQTIVAIFLQLSTVNAWSLLFGPPFLVEIALALKAESDAQIERIWLGRVRVIQADGNANFGTLGS
jgi:hypothetical protein